MKAAYIRLDPKNIVSPVDERLYGSFIEHMGRAVYTGIYEPAHACAGPDGFRRDVVDLIQPLSIPLVRYPGGNFVSGYQWEDGVGPRSARPVRPELAWQALEPNEVGTNEFMEFLRLIGAKPMLAVNLGTRGPQDAANLLEYCNFPGGTYYSDLRAAHGYPTPHNVKLWCLGNEMDGPWQICAKTAEEYGRMACEAAKMMKWLDPSIELVVCGSSFRDMPTFGEWERTVLRHTYEYVDYLSLHTYYANNDGDLPSFLANNLRMERFIREVAAICADIKREKGGKKDIRLSFDEWNVWYHFKKDCPEPPKWTVARPIEEERYDFADALLVGSMLITLLNNADTVKIACLAQLVNTIAPIMTEPGGRAWAQTIYYPFLYTSRYGRGTVLRAAVDVASYACAAGDAPLIDCAAVLCEGDMLSLFLVNKSLGEIACDVSLPGNPGVIDWVQLHRAPGDANTADRAPVQPVFPQGAKAIRGGIRFTLPPLCWNMLRLRQI